MRHLVRIIFLFILAVGLIGGPGVTKDVKFVKPAAKKSTPVKPAVKPAAKPAAKPAPAKKTVPAKKTAPAPKPAPSAQWQSLVASPKDVLNWGIFHSGKKIFLHWIQEKNKLFFSIAGEKGKVQLPAKLIFTGDHPITGFTDIFQWRASNWIALLLRKEEARSSIIRLVRFNNQGKVLGVFNMAEAPYLSLPAFVKVDDKAARVLYLKSLTDPKFVSLTTARMTEEKNKISITSSPVKKLFNVRKSAVAIRAAKAGADIAVLVAAVDSSPADWRLLTLSAANGRLLKEIRIKHEGKVNLIAAPKLDVSNEGNISIAWFEAIPYPLPWEKGLGENPKFKTYSLSREKELVGTPPIPPKMVIVKLDPSFQAAYLDIPFDHPDLVPRHLGFWKNGIYYGFADQHHVGVTQFNFRQARVKVSDKVEKGYTEWKAPLPPFPTSKESHYRLVHFFTSGQNNFLLLEAGKNLWLVPLIRNEAVALEPAASEMEAGKKEALKGYAACIREKRAREECKSETEQKYFQKEGKK